MMNEEAGTDTVGVSAKIYDNLKPNLHLMRKCFQEIISALKCKEKQFNTVQELSIETAKRLCMMRELIDVKLDQIRKEEEAFQLLQDKGFKDLELKRQDLGLILEGIKLWDDKFNEKENLIEVLFERIELEKKSIQKSIDEKFDEISQKERLLQDHSRELDLLKCQTDSREIELRKEEEVWERHRKELELSEKSLSLKNEELEAKENQLNLREKFLASREEDLITKVNELVSREKVLASRKEELVTKENAIGARERILDLKAKAKHAAANLVDGGRGELKSREQRKDCWESERSDTK